MEMNFKKALREVNIVLDEVLVFDVILNSVLIFLGVYLALVLLNMNPWYALYPTLGYFIYLLYEDVTKNKYLMVEKAYAPLYERLRTAADNTEKENELVAALQMEVVAALRNVPVSSFVKTPRITAKIFASVLLCFAILLAAIYNINMGRVQWGISDKMKGIFYGSGDSGKGGGTFELAAGQNVDDDIFGNETIAKIGDEALTMRIQQASFEVMASELEDPPRRDFEELFPDEITATASGSFEEDINTEHQKLVKDYFKELSKG